MRIWGLQMLASLVADVITRLIWAAGYSPPADPDPAAAVPLTMPCKWCQQTMYTAQEYCSHCGRQRFTGKARG